MITPMVVGNMKMYRTPSETEALLLEHVSRTRNYLEGPDGRRVSLVVAPPFTSLPIAARILAGTGIALGAQNCHWSEEGPYTGEVSAKMLAEIGCTYVILGHSEQREHFGETDRRISKKSRMALFWGVTPIICVGEKKDQRDSGRTARVVEAQLKRCLEDLSLDEGQRLIIAYEPVWAIGSGLTPEPGDVRSVHEMIRGELTAAYGEDRGLELPILYGGSVSPDNCGAMVDLESVDGFLVGGGSLKPADLFGVIKRVREARA